MGKFKANPWGFHDVHGNALEWCLDSPHPFGNLANSDPRSPFPKDEITNRVARGGSARMGAIFARIAFRINLVAGYTDAALGLRPARAIDP